MRVPKPENLRDVTIAVSRAIELASIDFEAIFGFTCYNKD